MLDIASDNFRLYTTQQADTDKFSIVYMTYLFYLWPINHEPESCKAIEKCFEVTKNVNILPFEGGRGEQNWENPGAQNQFWDFPNNSLVTL